MAKTGSSKKLEVLREGDLINREFRIDHLLAKSNLSEVYLATRVDRPGPVIIKLVRRDGIGASAFPYLQKEIDILNKLSHPHIVQFLNSFYDPQQSAFGIVTEYIRGKNVKEVLNECGALDVELCVRICLQLLDALQYTHLRNIIHCDLKPTNLILHGDFPEALDHPFLKVIDFGLGKVLAQSGGQIQSQITQGRGMGGTLAYMPPEGLDLRESVLMDHRADLYSLGVILFELLTGKAPFDASDPGQLIKDKKSHRYPDLRELRADVPEVLADIVDKLLSANPDERYHSASGLIEDLNRLYDLQQERSYKGRVELGRHDTSSPLWDTPPLAGRDAELSQLSEFLEKSCSGNGNVLLIGGEAGIGKTRLIAEFSKSLSQRGGWFVRGLCRENQRHTPYYPLIECANDLAAYFSTLPEDERSRDLAEICEAVENSAQLIVDILPPLEEMIRAKGPVSISPDQKAERFLFAFWRMVLVLAKSDRPFFFFIDDLQWADESTLKWLEYFSEQLQHQKSTAPLSIIAAYRSEALHPGDTEFARWFSRFDAGHLEQIQLAPLNENAVEYLLSKFFGQAGGVLDEGTLQQVLTFVQTKARGNPFYICELMKSLFEEKAILLEEGKWRSLPDRLNALKVSEDAVGLVLQRVSHLTEEEQNILNLASVFGTRFNLYDVAAVGSWRDEAVVSAIQKGRNLHMIAVDSSSTGSYQFAHDQIAQAFYQFLDPANLRKTHAKVGCHLERSRRGSGEERIFDLAYHFARSGETDRALRYLTEAGDLSYRIYANRQAVEYYLQSLRILNENREKLFEKGSDADRLAHHLHEHVGDVYVLLGEYGKAIEHFEFSAPLAMTPLEQARLERKTGQALFHAGELEAPVRHFKRCLSLLGHHLPESNVGVILSILGKVVRQIFPSAIRHLSLRTLFMSAGRRGVWREMALEVVRSCAVLTELFYFTQSLARSFQVHMTALNIAESIGDCRELAESYLIHGFNCFMGGWFSRGLRYEQLGRATYERLEDTAGVAKSYCYEGYAHMWAGNWDKGIEAARRSANLLETVGNLWQVEINYANWAFGYIHKGEFDRAINVLRELRAIIKSKRTERGLIDYHNHIALAYCRKGYLEQATQHVKEAERLCAESRQKFYLATTYTVYGEIFAVMEMYEDAENYLDKAIQIIEENKLAGDYAVWPSIVRAKVRVKGFAANAEASESHKKLKLAELEKDCRKALSLARRFRNHLPAAERTYGTFYEISGKYEKAEAYYKESLKISENMGSIYDAALSYVARGNLLIRLNERSTTGINALLKGEELFRQASAAIEMAKVKRTLNYIMPDREKKEAKRAEKPEQLLSRRVIEEQKIAAIFQMGSVMSSVLKIDLLLEKIMDLVIANFSAQRGFLILDEEILRLGQEKLSELRELGGEVYERLRSEFLSDRAVVLKDPRSKQRLIVKVARNVERSSIVTEEFQLSRTIIQKVFDTGKPALIVDALKDPALQTQKSVLLHQLRSIMCVPLRFVGTVLGVIYLDNSYVSELFTKQDLQILRYFASQAVVSIENVLIFRKFNIALNRMKELQSQLLHTGKISAIGQAVAKISHEINNPLTSIAGYAGMLKQVIPQDLPKAREYCDIIHKESHRCAHLVKEMLAFSKKGPAELKRLDLNQIIEESIRITDFFRPQNVTLQFERNPNLPQVVIDRGQMEQVFVNIISNAYQALESARVPAGIVTIRAAIDQPDRIAVYFSDNGPGIDPAYHEKIFEPFFTTKEKGTGLGLSIAYYIIQKHGGRLSFQSEPGKGTSFIIELPAVTSHSAAGEAPSAERKAA